MTNIIVKQEQNKGDLSFGCSSFSWETLDGKHLWGRNLDFNRLAKGNEGYLYSKRYQILYVYQRIREKTNGSKV